MVALKKQNACVYVCVHACFPTCASACAGWRVTVSIIPPEYHPLYSFKEESPWNLQFIGFLFGKSLSRRPFMPLHCDLILFDQTCDLILFDQT